MRGPIAALLMAVLSAGACVRGSVPKTVEWQGHALREGCVMTTVPCPRSCWSHPANGSTLASFQRHDVHVAQLRRIGDDIELGDPPRGERDVDHHHEPAERRNDDSDRSV